jgi:hypothetical protein
MGRVARGGFRWLSDLAARALSALFGRFVRRIGVLILIVAGVWFMLSQFQLPSFGIPLVQPTAAVVTRPSLVARIRAENTLVTAAFETEVTVDVEKDAPLSFLASERVVILAEGRVLAGIDLGEIDEDDVTIRDQEVTIRVPPAQIISQEVQFVQLRTDEGVLPGIDPDLQVQAEAQAREALLQSACASDLLPEAEEQAQRALADLLGTVAGIEVVRLVQTESANSPGTGCYGN